MSEEKRLYTVRVQFEAEYQVLAESEDVARELAEDKAQSALSAASELWVAGSKVQR